MVSLDKIKNNIPAEVYSTINALANEGNRERLNSWLKECKEEIAHRRTEKKNTYLLELEKYYLEYILG